MTTTDILILNLEEVRRRSLKVWHSIPQEGLNWKPDAEAMTCIELVRHVPECEYLYLTILRSGRRLPMDELSESLWVRRPFTSVEAEVEFAEPYRRELLKLIGSYTAEQLSTTVDYAATGQKVRTIGDFILRMAYHESVHTGQLLSYLRMMNVPRPNVWD
ncbi:MAG: DinB family protein [Pyrinomonadaceae bacterium]|nr:DinB family protein [Pyrinomonadaceae bacterium]